MWINKINLLLINKFFQFLIWKKKQKRIFDVEIDVWMERGAWKLGHDYPEHDTTMEFISQKGLFLHAKNLESLVALLSTDLHYFWHDVDHYTLTSKNFIWTFPQMKTKTEKMPGKCTGEHYILKSSPSGAPPNPNSGSFNPVFPRILLSKWFI